MSIQLFQIDEIGALFISAAISDWEPLNERGIDTIIDLDGGLDHCGMGFNRSALVAGLILLRLGMTGPQAVKRLRDCRPGALFKEVFAAHLESLDALGT